MEKVCRWCKHYKNGECINDNIKSIYDNFDVSPLQLLLEEGKIDEAVREGFTDYQFLKVQELLQSFDISQKRIDEIVKTLAEELASAKNEWVEEIGQSVVNSLDMPLENITNSFIIKYPETFYCKEWE